jgi:signal transduction histidine kinase
MKFPLVAILGLTKKIREHHDDMPAEKVEQYCKTIKDSGEQLESQVIEFFGIFQTDDRQNQTQPWKGQSIRTNWSTYFKISTTGSRKKLAIRTKYDTIRPVKVDRIQLQRVFENLLNNAIKFIHRGGEIVISIKKSEREVIDCSVRG